MSTFTAPGVYIEEVDSAVQGIEGVSTSNMGLVGWTLKGPKAERMPRLVTSFEQFVREFGGFTADSYTAYQAYTFFTNGGRRIYLQRVAPADAAVAKALVRSDQSDQELAAGDGATLVFSATAATTTLATNAGASPVAPGSFDLRWRAQGAAVTNRATFEISSPSTLLTSDGASSYFTGRLRPTTARGSIQALVAAPADGSSFVLNDGTNPAVTFEFDANSSVTETPTLRQIDTSGPPASAAALAVIIAAAINSAPTLNILAEVRAGADDTVVLHNTVPGAAGNQNITFAGLTLGTDLEIVPLQGGWAETTVDEDQFLVDASAAVVLTYDNGTADVTVTLGTRIDRWTYASAAAQPALTSDYGIIDLRTGIFSLRVGSGSTAASGSAITASFTYVLDRAATDDESGLLTGDVTGASPANILNYDTGAYNATVVAGAPATGSITTIVQANLVEDTDTFTIDDGVNAPVTFFFDLGAATTVVTTTTRSVDVSAATTADEVRDAIISAVGSAPALFVTATNGGAATVTLTHDLEGTIGNEAVLENVADAGFLVTGLTGGTDEDAPHGSITASEGAPLLADYSIDAWELDAVSAGEWGNDLRLLIQGNPDNFDFTTGTYSLWDVFVQLFNPETGNYDTKESFEGVDLTASTGALAAASVINAAGVNVVVIEPGAYEEPAQLQATAKTVVLSGGDQSSGGRNIITSLSQLPVQARTVTITYEDASGNTLTITDDGAGNLVGSVDPAGTNTINYSTGAINVTTLQTIGEGTLVSAAYSQAGASSLTVDFGDSATLVTDGAGAGAALPTISGSEVLTAGTNGTFDTTNYGQSQLTSPTLSTTKTGIYGLNKIDEVMQVVVPDYTGVAAFSLDIITYVESRVEQQQGADRFALLAPPQGSSAQDSADWVRITLNSDTKLAAAYGPWVSISDPLQDNRPLLVPPQGVVAGVYARTDNRRNVAKAPAGTTDGQIRGILGLEYRWDEDEQRIVAANKLNALLDDTSKGRVVWGVRTLSSDKKWRYVSVVRLFQFLAKSIWTQTQWVVFEPNDNRLRIQVKGQLDSFLGRLHGQRYFAGTSPSQSFSVKVDESNNPPESVDDGFLIVDVAVAPLKPAEFVRFRISQKSTTNN